MKTLTDSKALLKEKGPVVIAAGFFDGLHRGHRKVIERTIARRNRLDGKAWILTFDVHPRRLLNPQSAPRLLTSLDHKLKIMRRLNIDGCLVLAFSRELADLEPADFVNRLVRLVPNLAEIFVGDNWRFGRNAAGTPDMLRQLGAEIGLKVTVIPPVLRKGTPISSTRVRQEITRGNLDEAKIMLGRPFSILGTVTSGRRVASQMGFPTANLNPHNEVVPPFGVYAVYALLDNLLLDGVLNFGVRPTFPSQPDTAPVLELHLPDFKGKLYGRDVEVFFTRFLRAEKRFASIDDLAEQIRLDVCSARKVLAVKRKKVKESLYRNYRLIL